MLEQKKLFFQWAPLLLIWSCLMLLPASRSVEVPVLIMAILGLALACKHGKAFLWQGAAARYFTLIFLLFWIPVLLSLFGAANPGKVLAVLGSFPRYYLAGLFIMHAFTENLAKQRFLRLCAWGLLFWVGDSLLQFFRGVDLFGYTYTEGVRLSGIFGRYPAKLGWCMALFSPLLLIHARRCWHPVVQIGVFAGVLSVVLLSFSRGGWIALAVILAVYGLYTLREQGRPLLRTAAAVLIAGGLGVAGMYLVSPGFAATVQRTSLIFKGDVDSINQAITWRVPIWRTATKMFLENPVNGVGARGFRFAYVEHAAAEDFFVEPWAKEPGAMHPHQLLLELASETGLVGLAGWLAAMVLLFRLWNRAETEQKRRMLPYGLALFAAFFPINTHFALYSSAWSQVLFWFVALYCAHTARPMNEVDSIQDFSGNPASPDSSAPVSLK